MQTGLLPAIKESLSVQKALSIEGGFIVKVAGSRMNVLRKVIGREQSIPVDVETIMLLEDIFIVPGSLCRAALENVGLDWSQRKINA